ncbi:MAG TPA: Wadjet anti-phage system protein JetD domain-containing protein [Clostridium sp.]|uniref:Wadjet anti-phage system protein JetD domain-containing protein n=1 Tax=Clostridium sp. TaxID=1506 RepID=UPI002F91EFD6
MKNLRTLNKKRIDIDELQQFLNIIGYIDFANTVTNLVIDNVILPIKSSKLNGKNPSLYNRYTIIALKEDNSKYTQELSYTMNIHLDKTYYIKNIDKYKDDRVFVLALSRFLDESINLLNTQISANERSFQIWQREKFLNREGGKRILNNLNLSSQFLNIYDTTQPLSYYSYSKTSPQKILILENKDTFYSMRKHLINGSNKIFGDEISTLIYGGGKNIYRTFEDFEVCAEPYLMDKKNEILYLGDLDYEGIIIYEGLYKIFKENFNIKPFVKGYASMIDKFINENIGLPNTKDGQNRNIGQVFTMEFTQIYRDIIINILSSDKYIPQEILNISDF